MKLGIVIVTYNRRQLLERCLLALNAQNRLADKVWIINNASTDDTRQWLTEWLPTHMPNAEPVHLSENSGGAGGFSEGMECAINDGCGWVWMMDDDAEPHADALGELLKIADNPDNIYGSLAVKGADTSWITTLVDQNHRIVDKAADVPRTARVQSLPFLGFLIHSTLIRKIGLPDAGYFIAADDIEYCMRAERAGAKIFIAGKSLIDHPKSDRYVARLPGRRLICLKLPPWKRYYDTRNRLLIARKYYGIRIITQTIPGSFVRLLAALWYEPRRLAQLWAFFAGMTDGLLGRKGPRHGKWHISQ